jgi:hypothetical protein
MAGGGPRMATDRAASRAETIWNLLAAHAASSGGGPASVADVCAVCVETVGLSGAAVTALGKSGPGHVMCVTDEVSEQIEELQLTFGEGPRVDASADGAPVLVPDLGADDVAARWPAFGPAARLAGAAAMFALPLQIGAISVGVLSLYRRQPGPLSADQLGDALVFADTATVLMIDREEQAAADGGGGTGPGGQSWQLALHRAEIDQATGMLTEQLGVGIEEAFVRLRAYAYAQDRRLADVARDVVARTLRMEPDPNPRRDGAA